MLVDHLLSSGLFPLGALHSWTETMSQPASAGSSTTRSCIFYKLIVPSIIHEKRLRIPEKFIRRFGDELSTVVRLTVPNGRIWLVGLKRDQTKIWLYNGWQEFVEHYSIRVGYILVFKYEGLSNFKVQVFNLPTSELNYQSRGRNCSEEPNYGKHYHVFEEMEDDDSVENVGSSSSLYPAPRDGRVDQLTLGMSYNPPAAQNMFNGPKHENAVDFDDGEDWRSPRGVVGNPHEAMLSRNGIKSDFANGQTQRPQKGARKRKIDGYNQESSDQHGGGEVQFILNNRAPTPANGRVVTAEERERVLNASKAFEPTNPFCRVVLRPSYLYRGCIMYLPSCFAGKHLSGVSGFIKLQDPAGKLWSVRYLYKGSGARLGRGWFDFSLGNNLQEGDVCVFELINVYDVVLKVSIFHVLADAPTQVNQPQPSHYSTAPKSIRF